MIVRIASSAGQRLVPCFAPCTAIANTRHNYSNNIPMALEGTDCDWHNGAVINNCSEKEVSKFTISATSEENGGRVEFYHDNIRKEMSQICHKGVHQRAEIKVLNSNSKLCLAVTMK